LSSDRNYASARHGSANLAITIVFILICGVFADNSAAFVSALADDVPNH